MPLIEVDPDFLVELETTGSVTNPFWRLPPPPGLPSIPALSSLPPPLFIPSLPPPPRFASPTPPPPRAAPHEVTRPDIRPPRRRESMPAPVRSLMETTPATLRPAARSLPAPPRPKPIARAAGYGVLAGVALFASAWLIAKPSSATATAYAVVTATDTRGQALRSAQVVVDGVPSCEATPCSIDVEPGGHQVDVIDRTTEHRASRSFSVAKGERTTLHFALPAEVATARPAAPPPPNPDAPIAVSALPREAQAERPAPSATATPAEVPRPTAGAFLSLNSIPIASVLIDGRPVGSTPLVGLAVGAGTHSVTFAHPELGRRSAAIQIGPGEKKAVVVRFRKPAPATEE